MARRQTLEQVTANYERSLGKLFREANKAEELCLRMRRMQRAEAKEAEERKVARAAKRVQPPVPQLS